MNHVFIAGQCIHCGCDDHDPESIEACPVPDGPDRQAEWTFGPDGSDEIPD